MVPLRRLYGRSLQIGLALTLLALLENLQTTVVAL
jgi:hypothetical protein